MLGEGIDSRLEDIDKGRGRGQDKWIPPDV
jgi:hypothetical protein